MALSDPVLVDTSALYAIQVADDRFHDKASVAYQRFIDQERALWTTSYALVETLALFQRRLGFEAVSEFAEWHTNLDIFWMDSRAHGSALAQLLSHQGSRLSFVDWSIVVAARQLHATIFTFDSDFANQGLPIVPA